MAQKLAEEGVRGDHFTDDSSFAHLVLPGLNKARRPLRELLEKKIRDAGLMGVAQSRGALLSDEHRNEVAGGAYVCNTVRGRACL